MGGISCRRHAFVLLGGVKCIVSVSLSEEEVRMDEVKGLLSDGSLLQDEEKGIPPGRDSSMIPRLLTCDGRIPTEMINHRHARPSVRRLEFTAPLFRYTLGAAWPGAHWRPRAGLFMFGRQPATQPEMEPSSLPGESTNRQAGRQVLIKDDWWLRPCLVPSREVKLDGERKKRKKWSEGATSLQRVSTKHGNSLGRPR